MKLVTYNTQWCCGNDGTVSPERIVQVARNLADFDVLCLQEIAVNYPRLQGTRATTSRRCWRSCCPASSCSSARPSTSSTRPASAGASAT